jgi:DNA-binding PadR family transcriptional regulator
MIYVRRVLYWYSRIHSVYQNKPLDRKSILNIIGITIIQSIIFGLRHSYPMETHPISPKDLLPLSPTAFQMLVSLADGEKHGYAIRKSVEQDTDGLVKIRIGSLYSHIQRLTEAGLIEESDRRPAPDQDDQRRRYYRLTGFGRKVLTAEAERIHTLLALVESKEISLGSALVGGQDAGA